MGTTNKTIKELKNKIATLENAEKKRKEDEAIKNYYKMFKGDIPGPHF